MSDLPFGFSGNDPDRDDDKNTPRDEGGEAGSGSGGLFGFDPSQFDPSTFDPSQLGALGADFDPSTLNPEMIGQMFSQLGSMFSAMGAGAAGGTGSAGAPVNYDIAKQIARREIGDFTPVLDKETNAVADAVRLAETWLDAASALPAGVTTSVAWTPVQWLEESLPTWATLCDPVAKQLSQAWAQGMPEEAAAFAGPMMGMLSQLSGSVFGTQLGQGLGKLATEVLTGTDIGLPLAPSGTAVLLPEAIAAFADGLDLPAQEIIVYLAAREAAHVRLFTHVGWLRQRLLSTVEQFAAGIKVDVSGIADSLGGGVNPEELMANPEKFSEMLGSAASFEPTPSPEQQAALERLETLLALIEGWVEHVVTQALGDRIPSTAALTETIRRRRATGGPAEQTFATLVGLELRPRRVREATALWDRLLQATDPTVRDRVWDHPDLLADSSDLDNPAAFIDGVLSDDPDPLAALEKTIAEEENDDDD
ncbi:zinc-dependent metalloprotease [Gordonia sp. X0973]|uniref:zinc-dependent metalloprotease n=1 Tax=Gordonia sp. X0973 TaxID=2742602 RepID=UPI000F54BA20|nr:zinc-dependent metalloprotease [Gordonia sp. X0973]QKT08067.1 zinc-dependent metalloprotease [Gordonia sp. X0973]